MISRLVRDPLLHFLLLGAVIFLIFGRPTTDQGSGDRQITVTAADVDRLELAFTRTWNRPPDDEERRAQIRDYIREEVLYRAALELGLDKDDAIVRRRLRQKVEFLFEDTVAAPKEEDLRAYFDAHKDKFQSEAAISFRQIFVSGRRGEAARADAGLILARLATGASGAEEEGDAFPLGEGFGLTSVSRIGSQFGDDFAHKLTDAPVGRWAGPFASAFGQHLVLVTERRPATLAPFEQVRAAVEREWYAERRAAAQDEQFKVLLARYKVIVLPRDQAP